MTDTSTISTNHVVSAKKRVTFGGLIGKLIDAIFKAVLLVLVIVILTPIVYFAWRAGQPMDLPEFKGLTYYQVLSDRQAALYNKALEYHQAHPTVRISMNMCFITEVVYLNIIEFPVSGALVVWNWLSPTDPYFTNSLRNGYLRATSVADIFPVWWTNYESLLVFEYSHKLLVSYCNIAPPTGP